ncbi:type IV pilus modification PilV family protein [Stieleria varia]|uniref:Type II secretion system protein n=1 Tax=Stieleria varia TaxID=2528005 RepID=A0A5C6AGD4_9BACT|nr:hypothetical protein [Stieleria varia]TWT98255.1 hypothetical protein Pla52n_47650 [Stieleria varia]
MNDPARRNGLTLVEVVAVLGCLLFIGVTATTLLQRVALVGKEVAQNELAVNQIQRLADDLRSDVQAAETIESTAPGQLKIQVGGKIIEYFVRQRPKRIERLIRNEPEGQLETYCLTETCEPGFAVGNEAVKLKLSGDSAAENEWLAVWIIQARRTP